MTFTVTPLVSGGYLVEGQDSKGVDGTTVLHSQSWDYVQHLRTHEVAEAEFNDTVEAFFKPIVDAADAFNAKLAGPTNQWGTVTIGETVEGKQARTLDLDEAGIVLRILDETDGGSLRWVSAGGTDVLVAVL
jgi:hypothetical protein